MAVLVEAPVAANDKRLSPATKKILVDSGLHTDGSMVMDYVPAPFGRESRSQVASTELSAGPTSAAKEPIKLRTRAAEVLNTLFPSSKGDTRRPSEASHMEAAGLRPDGSQLPLKSSGETPLPRVRRSIPGR